MAVEYKQFFEFDLQHMPNWYKGLKPDEKEKFQTFVNRLNSIANVGRANGLPEKYLGIGRKIAKRFNTSQPLMDEQVYALDQTIIKTLYAADTFAQIVGGSNLTVAANSWEVKNYKLKEDSIMPALDKDFKNPPVITLGLESEYHNGIGCAIAYEVPWTEIERARGGIYNPDFYYAMVAAEKMGRFLDYLGYWGSASALSTPSNADYGVKGLINHATAAANTFTGTGLTSYGGVRTALMAAMAKLKNVRETGKNVLITTSGVATQCLLNTNSTTDKTELSWIKEDLIGPKPTQIQEWWITDRLFNSATDPSASQQAIVLAKLGPLLQKNSVVFPLQTKPMLNKTYAEDIKEALLYGNVFTQYGVTTWPVCEATGLTTTNTGIFGNGRFL